MEKLNFHKTHGKAINKENSFNTNVGVSQLRQINTRILGGGASQGFAAFKLFEHYIAYEAPEYVVEIGSQKGGLSLYIANIASVTEQFLFHTFEINKNRDWYNREVEGIGHWFEKLEIISPYIKSFEGDCFSQEIIDLVASHINLYGKTLIICDGGDKAKEVEVYSRIMKKGDVIMAHDFPDDLGRGEIFDKDINMEILDYCEPWNQRFIDNKTLFKVFIKK